MQKTYLQTNQISFEEFKKNVLADYKLARISREMSLLGRREVLTGKAKFGIFGDGKELPQVAMSRVFREGDWRSGYYRLLPSAVELLRLKVFSLNYTLILM